MGRARLFARPARILAPWAALLVAACSGSGNARGAAPAPAPAGARATSSADAATAEVGGAGPAAAAAPAMPAFVVTWEALAVEREQAENPRFGRRPQQGALAAQKVILVNESHPEAQKMRRGRTAMTQNNQTVAVVSDADMQLLLQGFDQAGFYRHARATDTIAPWFEKPDARGRISVEGNGRDLSVVSMRGQGLQQQTREIPALYSQLKQAVAAVRNATPTLNVRTAGAVGSARAP
jgi:hypothetical protein